MRYVKDSTQPQSAAFRMSFRKEVVLCRLCIVHTHLTHRFLMNRRRPRMCAVYGKALTVEHVLLSCCQSSRTWRLCHLPPSLSKVRGDELPDVILLSVSRCIYFCCYSQLLRSQTGRASVQLTQFASLYCYVSLLLEFICFVNQFQAELFKQLLYYFKLVLVYVVQYSHLCQGIHTLTRFFARFKKMSWKTRNLI